MLASKHQLKKHYICLRCTSHQTISAGPIKRIEKLVIR